METTVLMGKISYPYKMFCLLCLGSVEKRCHFQKAPLNFPAGPDSCGFKCNSVFTLAHSTKAAGTGWDFQRELRLC